MVPNHSQGTLLGGSSHVVLVDRALNWFYLICKSVLTSLMKWENSSKDGDYDCGSRRIPITIAADPRCKVKHPAKAVPNVSVSQGPAAQPAREAGCRCVVTVGNLIR